jgi:hypothetical protein
MSVNGIQFGFINQGAMSNYQQAVYNMGSGDSPIATESKNLGNFQSDRMKAIMAQLSQYVDADSAHVLRQNIVDTVKAQKAHQFFKQTSAQLDAANIKTDFQMAMSYLNMVG